MVLLWFPPGVMDNAPGGFLSPTNGSLRREFTAPGSPQNP
jgi:hypothetical protein